MIVLDTNVVSALMTLDRTAVAWLDRQPGESIWTTAVTVFEIAFGCECLPAGRRRRALEDAFARTLAEELEGRVLGFDEAAARAAARLAAARRKAGRPLDKHDAQIAGIVAARKATLATRNVRDFAGLGIALANPWE